MLLTPLRPIINLTGIIPNQPTYIQTFFFFRKLRRRIFKMSEILQIFHQSPPSRYQMHSLLQRSPVNVESQFNRSFESSFASPDVSDHFQCYDFAGSSSVDELSMVTAIVEKNQSLSKRKFENVDCNWGLTRSPEARNSIHNGNSNPKIDLKPEPEYVHVRARRGQATDSHSLAERARREKIKKKMQYLQDLVPGCNKLTNKAAILDEIITYVQCLQRDAEVKLSPPFWVIFRPRELLIYVICFQFLTIKLAALTASEDFNMDNSLPEVQQIQLPSGSECILPAIHYGSEEIVASCASSS
ncbi:hypothetical protein R6Q59_008128 [Mikania micrantha]